MRRSPVFRLSMQGNIANRMIQYMAALKLKSIYPEVNIANVELPEWNINIPDDPQRSDSMVLGYTNRIDFDGVVQGYSQGNFEHVVYPWYAQRMENFLPRQDYAGIFPPSDENLGWGDEYLVINIRGGEILEAPHPAYVLLPLDFYDEVIRREGRQPVFMGQIEDNIYVSALRERFPQAIFQPSRGVLEDFQSIRQSKNIVPSVSTFSWLACWLSDGTIHLPLAGLLNPFQELDHDFIPIDQKNYRYYTFPIMNAVPVAEVADNHAGLVGVGRPISQQALQTILEQKPRFRPSRQACEALFDPGYYLERYPDILAAFGFDLSAASDHYKNFGYDEFRDGFLFEEKDYFLNNPYAAEAVGKGDYMNAREYFIDNT